MTQESGDGNSGDEWLASTEPKGYADRNSSFQDVGQKSQSTDSFTGGAKRIGGPDIAAAVLSRVLAGQNPGKKEAERHGANQVGRDHGGDIGCCQSGLPQLTVSAAAIIKVVLQSSCLTAPNIGRKRVFKFGRFAKDGRKGVPLNYIVMPE